VHVQREKRKDAQPRICRGVESAPAVVSKAEFSNFGPIWNVNIQKLKDSSTIFPIERTHAVLNGISASVVADRVVACLEENSIYATFNNDKAMAVAETDNHTTFEIWMYRHRNNDQNGNLPSLLLEVQRKSGCSISFHWVARAILKAAKGISVAAAVPRPSISSFIPPPSKKAKIAQENDVFESIENVHSLLEKDRFDANILGMQTLRSLTSLQSTTAETAATVSKLILVGNEEMSAIGDKVKSIVQNGCNNDDYECDMERHYGRIMYSHALGVIANSLDIISTIEDFNSLESDKWFIEDLLSLLLTEIQCIQRPHDACEAARCLNVLVGASTKFRVKAVNSGALPTVLDMVKNGTYKHQRLQKELEKSSAALIMAA